MLYAVADDDWTPGSPLAASGTRAGLYRTRREADAIAAGRRLLAVSVRYDATRGLVAPMPAAVVGPSRGWSAPAIVGPGGGVTPLATIPGPLVRAVGPPRLRVHPGHPAPPPRHARDRGRAAGGRGRG